MCSPDQRQRAVMGFLEAVLLTVVDVLSVPGKKTHHRPSIGVVGVVKGGAAFSQRVNATGVSGQ
jgi:hypothetical protein